MQRVSELITQQSFAVVKRGYDQSQVETFVEDVAAEVAKLEEMAKTAELRANALDRQLGDVRKAEEAVSHAYLAAAEAKHKLLERAQLRADEILAEAAWRVEAAGGVTERTSGPDRRIHPSVGAAPDIDTQAAAERILLEAREVLESAKKEGDRIVTTARADALAALAEGREAAETLIADARTERDELTYRLRELGAAVAAMIERTTISSLAAPYDTGRANAAESARVTDSAGVLVPDPMTANG